MLSLKDETDILPKGAVRWILAIIREGTPELWLFLADLLQKGGRPTPFGSQVTVTMKKLSSAGTPTAFAQLNGAKRDWLFIETDRHLN